MQGIELLNHWFSKGFMDSAAYRRAISRYNSHRCEYRAWGEATGYPKNVTIFDLYGSRPSHQGKLGVAVN